MRQHFPRPTRTTFLGFAVAALALVALFSGCRKEDYLYDATLSSPSNVIRFSCERNWPYPLYSSFQAVAEANNTTFELSFDGNEGWRAIFADDITVIPKAAFVRHTDLLSITLPNSVVTIGDSALANTGITSFAFPLGVTRVPAYMFQYCVDLTDVILPEGIVEIDLAAFEYCHRLSHVNIPGSLRTIGDQAFKYCSALPNMNIPVGVEIIGSSTFMCCTTLTHVNIPASVQSLGGHMFDGCSALKSVSVPNSISRIPDAMFSDCVALESIFIPNSVEVIEKNAFRNCSTLSQLFIPGSVDTIDSWAFQDCVGLTLAVIGNGVKLIGYDSFGGCSNLELVSCYCLNAPQLYYAAFNDISPRAVLHILPGAQGYDDDFATGYSWSSYFRGGVVSDL